MAISKWRRRWNLLKAADLKPFLWAFLPPLACILTSYFFGFSERAIRVNGLGLQLMGLLGVVWGLNLTRQEFGLPSIQTAIARWLTRLVVGDVHFSVGHVDASAGAHVQTSLTTTKRDLPTEKTIEQRLTQLELELSAARESIAQLDKRMNGEVKTLKDEIVQEAEHRKAAMQFISQRLERVAVGGVWLSMMGSTWLFFGLVFGAVAPEISDWLNGRPVRVTGIEFLFSIGSDFSLDAAPMSAHI